MALFPAEPFNRLSKIDGTRSIEIKSEYANQYSAGGDNALIDYQFGSSNYRTGSYKDIKVRT